MFNRPVIDGIPRILNVIESIREEVVSDISFRTQRLVLTNEKATKIDKRPASFVVPDQADTGFCVAFAAATTAEYAGLERPSEQWLYLAADSDEFPETYGCFTGGGTSTKAVLDRMRKDGMLSQSEWPFEYPPKYYIGEYADACKNAKNKKLKEYYNLGVGRSAIETYKRFLTQYPLGQIVGGVLIDSNYMYVDSTGIVEKYDTNNILGGHELVIGGYDEETGKFFYDGSYSWKHGKNGRVIVPEDYVQQSQMDAYGLIFE